MRLTLIAPAVAGLALAVATPALADDTHVEVNTSGNFYGGDYQQSIGAAVGHDFTIAPMIFAGPEVAVQKILATNTLTSAEINGRLGASLGPAGKIFAIGGWSSSPYHGGNPDWSYGAGYSHALSMGTYGKIEYRHFTSSANGGTPSRDQVMLGFGLHI